MMKMMKVNVTTIGGESVRTVMILKMILDATVIVLKTYLNFANSSMKTFLNKMASSDVLFSRKSSIAHAQKTNNAAF
jgi:hypothetical protein